MIINVENDAEKLVPSHTASGMVTQCFLYRKENGIPDRGDGDPIL